MNLLWELPDFRIIHWLAVAKLFFPPLVYFATNPFKHSAQPTLCFQKQPTIEGSSTYMERMLLNHLMHHKDRDKNKKAAGFQPVWLLWFSVVGQIKLMKSKYILKKSTHHFNAKNLFPSNSHTGKKTLFPIPKSDKWETSWEFQNTWKNGMTTLFLYCFPKITWTCWGHHQDLGRLCLKV